MMNCPPGATPERMTFHNRSRISLFSLIVITNLLAVISVLAQVPVTGQLPREDQAAPPSTAQSTASPTPTPSPSPEADSRQIYGLQGVLVETLDGKNVAAQSVDQTFNPASAIKLATALVAMRSLGPHHRFNTGLWTNGTIDKVNGTINGNLYVSGRDPSFHYEHAVMLARQLNSLGVRTVTGDLIVAPGFTMNFNWSARRSGEGLYDTLDATLRPTEAASAWTYARTAFGDHSALSSVPSVAVMGDVYVNPVPPGAKLLFTHQSSKLTDILKVLLCYSNNFMAERLGDSLGGVDAVQNHLIKTLGIPSWELRLASLSGLGVNRVTPRAMMKVFRALREELRKHKLKTTDIMPVAGVDPGTLQERFTDLASRGSVVAKTGTLVRTDGGVSSLVGQMRTSTGEILLFVILNQRGSVLRFRDNQDFLVKQVQSLRGGPRAFDYRPVVLAMRLADTRSKVPATSEEYEPSTASGHGP
jgi:D-alanyl-D-alanine carboxypeptidase/D-alanyl-D-alanine-endopeptidase (penicillin-binding protein 4)